jgi:hypothetical protein
LRCVPLIEQRNLLATLLKKLCLQPALFARVSSAESGSNVKGNHRIVSDGVPA